MACVPPTNEPKDRSDECTITGLPASPVRCNASEMFSEETGTGAPMTDVPRITGPPLASEYVQCSVNEHQVLLSVK